MLLASGASAGSNSDKPYQVAIWLVPAHEQRSQIQKVISDLSAQYSSSGHSLPVFSPHMTLCTGVIADKDVDKGLRALFDEIDAFATNHEEFSLPVMPDEGRIDERKKQWSQFLFLHLDKTDAPQEALNVLDAKKAFRPLANPNPDWDLKLSTDSADEERKRVMLHVSLMYNGIKDSFPDIRKKVQNKNEYVLPDQVVFESIQVVTPRSGEWRDVLKEHPNADGDWDVLYTRKLKLPTPPLRMVMAGGQTGVDQAAWRAARLNRILIGGWCPMFSLNEQGGKDDDRRSANKAPELTVNERNAILSELVTETRLRQQTVPELLKIVAHGTEYGRLRVNEGEQIRCWIPEGIKVVEIWAKAAGRDVLLATHWVRYTESAGIAPASAIIDLPDGRRLSLLVRPEDDGSGNRGAQLVAQVSPLTLFARLGRFLVTVDEWPRLAWIGASILVVGSALAALYYRHEADTQRVRIQQLNQQLANEKANRDSIARNLEAATGPVQAYRLIPDEYWTRSGDASKQPVVTVPARPTLVILELPLDQKPYGSYRATLRDFDTNREIMTESLPAEIESGGRSIANFSLPSLKVESQKRYILSIARTNEPIKSHAMTSFTFYVVKN